MKETISELDLLLTKLEKEMPKTHLRKKHAKSRRKIKYSGDFEKLEQQLKTLEKDLSSLKI